MIHILGSLLKLFLDGAFQMSLVTPDNGVNNQPVTEQPVQGPVVDLHSLGLGDTAAILGNQPQTGGLLDLKALSLSQDFDALTDVKRIVTDILVGRQSNQAFIRIHPDEDHRLLTRVLEDKEARDTYLVDPELWEPLSGELTRKVLFTGTTRQSTPFIWGIRLPDDNGKLDPWNTSALEAARLAKDHWIRVVSNMVRGAYDI